MNFSDRFATELRSWLPDDVEVHADRVMVVIIRGKASAPLYLPGGDRRRRVETDEAREFLADAARKLSGEISNYREQFKAPARELVEILHRAAGADTTPDGADDGTTADAPAPVSTSRGGKPVPRFTYARESVPPGRQAHVGDGAWLKRCRVPDCDVTWENPDGAFPLYVPEHAEHEASHPGTLVPGYNVGMLP